MKCSFQGSASLIEVNIPPHLRNPTADISAVLEEFGETANAEIDYGIIIVPVVMTLMQAGNISRLPIMDRPPLLPGGCGI